MNFFHRWCARVAKKHQDAIKNEIEDNKKILEHATLCTNLCEKARNVAGRWKGIKGVDFMGEPYSNEDIETMVHFIHLKVDGKEVEWEKVVKDSRDWFTRRGLEIPKID